MHTNQKEHTVPEFELFEFPKFHMVPRSTATITEHDKGQFIVGEHIGRRVAASIHTSPAELVQVASDALLLAEHLRERQSALQAEKEAEKDAQEAQEEKEARTLYEAVGGVNWDKTSYTIKQSYYRLALKAREIYGVRK